MELIGAYIFVHIMYDLVFSTGGLHFALQSIFSSIDSFSVIWETGNKVDVDNKHLTNIEFIIV